MQSKNCYWGLTDCFNIYCGGMAQQASSFPHQKPPWRDSVHQSCSQETLENNQDTASTVEKPQTYTDYIHLHKENVQLTSFPPHIFLLSTIELPKQTCRESF